MNDEAKPNPMLAAQTNMRGPVIKRFYRTASVEETKGGWALKLDGRLAHTPGKAPLVAPTRAIAKLIAAEWNAQREVIDPRTMPATRLANSAIDGVTRSIDETRAEIARYAGSDLVCYRAEAPEALIALQASAHDPVLAWAESELSARFRLARGVTHVAQPEETLQRANEVLEAYNEPFAVAALHVLTSLSGSALLALAVARSAVTAEAAWRAAHVDEDFQISKWGEDFEAAERRAARWREFEAAARVFRALGSK
jgi:chaperone required for assembly of F1-ATPase